jgi:hypothetical protein
MEHWAGKLPWLPQIHVPIVCDCLVLDFAGSACARQRIGFSCNDGEAQPLKELSHPDIHESLSGPLINTLGPPTGFHLQN